MEKKKEMGIPKFKSLEKEKKYWEARGPLAKGHRGRINKPKAGQKRSSFLAVRLTGEELTRLRDIAAELGLGPSTFARIVLTSTIQRQARLPRQITVDDIRNALEENLSQPLIDKAEEIVKAISIGNPPFLLEINKLPREEWERLTLQFISYFLAMGGVKVVNKDTEQKKIMPDSEKIEQIK